MIRRRNNLIIIALFLVLCFPTVAQSIYRTACQGNIARLDSLLRDTVITIQDDRGRSLLHWAVACDQKEVVEFLITKGITTNSRDNEGRTPLYMAVRFKNAAVFDRLVVLEEETEWTKTEGAALLERAILNKDLAFVEKLIANQVDINAVNNRGSTPLEIALRTEAIAIGTWLIANGANEHLVRKIRLKGTYMGQEAPGRIPKVFAPNFISTEESEFGSVFNATGTAFYYGVDVNGKNEIRYSRLEGTTWTVPEILLSHERYGYNDPFLSQDENRLYFISRRALDGQGDLKDQDIWYVQRTEDGWSSPINVGPNINSEGNEYYISFTDDGTLYFSSNQAAPDERRQSDYDIYYSKFSGGTFQKAVRLGDTVNTQAYEADVFIDPRGSYLIFCGIRTEGYGRGDLYISFKNADGNWSEAVNMGDAINTKHHELCPFVSKDGNYLFYTSNQDIYWVSTAIFEELKRKG
ncbi:MAG: ankyrin repeat domain-containing protein [Bacteroidota bacterium]